MASETPTSPTPSPSEELRLKGNNLYREASQDQQMAPAVKRQRYEEAIRFYRQALNATKRDEYDAYFSCTKNMALSHFRLAETANPDSNNDRVYFCWAAKQAISTFLECYFKAASSKPQEWLADIRKKVMELVAFITEKLDVVEPRQVRLKCYHDLSGAFDNWQSEMASAKWPPAACFYLEMATQLFHHSVEQDVESVKNNANNGSTSPRNSLSSIHDCYRPLELARLFAASPAVQENVADLQSQVDFQQCKCESVMLRLEADRELGTMLADSEHLNMDTVYHVLDLYKQAILAAREIDIENEAIAIASIAGVYKRVLRMNDRAHAYYLAAIQMAHSMFPREFVNQLWYKECVAAVEADRVEKEREESEIRKQERQPYLKALKAELDEIRNVDGTASLLKYLYEKYPPKNPNNTLGPLDDENVKKSLQRAIVHYHRDTQSGGDMKWKVLCEEITKVLTRRYNISKGIGPNGDG